MRKKKTRRGGYWGGLISAVFLGEMLECNTITAQRMLYKYRDFLGRDLNPKDLCDLIFRYRLRRENAKMEKLSILNSSDSFFDWL